jgi:hypothetical protein
VRNIPVRHMQAAPFSARPSAPVWPGTGHPYLLRTAIAEIPGDHIPLQQRTLVVQARWWNGRTGLVLYRVGTGPAEQPGPHWVLEQPRLQQLAQQQHAGA